MLSRSELEHISLVTHIKEGILANPFSQEIQGIKLVTDPTLYNGNIRTDYKILDPLNETSKDITSRGKGLLSFNVADINPCSIYDPSTSGYFPLYGTPMCQGYYTVPQVRENNYIVVRDQYNNIIQREYYEIDYINARIRFPLVNNPAQSGIEPATIDLRYHTVAVVDGWPTDDKPPELPIVCVYPSSYDTPSGFQIGPGLKFIRKYNIDIYGKSSSNVRSIIDYLLLGLVNKKAPVIDFNRYGYPLNYWGTINKNFIHPITYNNKIYYMYSTLNPGNGNILYFVNIETDYNVTNRESMSDISRHTARIRLTTKSYTDRDPNLIGKFNSLEEPIGGFDSLTSKAYS